MTQTTENKQYFSQLRLTATNYSNTGQFLDAIKTQVQLINALNQAGDSNFQDKKVLGVYLFNAGDYEGSIQLLHHLNQLDPNDAETLENMGVVYKKLGQLPEAIKALEAALKLTPNKPNIYDALAHSYGNLGDIEKAHAYGETALLLKDKEAQQCDRIYPIPKTPPPPFDYEFPNKNIISFSLWGNHPRYLQGAIKNAQLTPDIYPGWRCRFYCDDSIPHQVRHHLTQLGAQLTAMPQAQNFYDGLFWRFLVASDPTVNRFLVRDCDSVINIKERVAVDEWLASNEYFHVMRDYLSHTEVILAGMWGGVGGILPPLKDLQATFQAETAPTKTYDQLFLRKTVWPTIRQSCLIHDSQFQVLGARPFPAYGNLAPNRHIGQNEWWVQQNLERQIR